MQSRAGRVAGGNQPAGGEPGAAEKRPALGTLKLYFRLKKEELKEAELYDGHYLFRSNLDDQEPEWLWKLYILLVEIEAVFKGFENHRSLRPIYQATEPRREAHIFKRFLAYCLRASLEQRWSGRAAPGLTPYAMLETLAGVQRVDWEVPTTDGRWPVLSRYTQSDQAAGGLLTRLKMKRPDPPPLSAQRMLTI